MPHSLPKISEFPQAALVDFVDLEGCYLAEPGAVARIFVAARLPALERWRVYLSLLGLHFSIPKEDARRLSPIELGLAANGDLNPF